MTAAAPSVVAGRFGRQMQVAWVVSDIEAAMAYWVDVLRVGPFFFIADSSIGYTVVHGGVEREVRFAVAFSHVGETQVEIIMPLDDTPSPYTEFLGSGREGLHHIAFWPPDFEDACAALVQAGMRETSSFHVRGKKTVAYFSGLDHLGVIIELVPGTPTRMRYFERYRAIAKDWDGSRPIRRFADLAEFAASPEIRPA